MSSATAPSRPRRLSLVLAVALVASVMASLPTTAATATAGDHRTAVVHDQSGTRLGSVTFTELADGRVEVAADLLGLTAGFHAFNVTDGSECTASFATAGEHLGGGAVHPAHAGDLPSLYARGSTLTYQRVVTDRFTLADITGRTVIVRTGADNFANIPDADGSGNRYDSASGPVPDTTTLVTGDGGTRIGCGVITTEVTTGSPRPTFDRRVSAVLTDAAGVVAGSVAVYGSSSGIEVVTDVAGLTPGSHGIHVHAGTTCTTTEGAYDFSLAGGHLGADTAGHGAHTGDLSSLLALADGTARGSTYRAAQDVETIRGRAVIVHAGPDNHANIPASDGAGTRYTSPSGQVPDATTKASGDSGGRVLCGVLHDSVTSQLRDTSGAVVGSVLLQATDDGELITLVDLAGATPGFHGTHIHEGTTCTTDDGSADFRLAGGHLGSGTTSHGAHAGDLPPVLVGPDGVGRHAAGLAGLDLTDVVGRTFVVHSGPDNLADIPDRYSTTAGAGPDATTSAAGDSGSRVACGVLALDNPPDPEFVDSDQLVLGFAIDQAGAQVGLFFAEDTPTGVRIFASFEDQAPGFHGIHIHEGSRCTTNDGTPDFSLAGGHLGNESSDHGAHPGDLPALLVEPELGGAVGGGLALLETSTLQLSDLRGRTVIVHAGSDNLANIPDRYATTAGTGPDAATLATGDGGARAACAELRQLTFAAAVARLAGNGRVATAIAISADGWADDTAAAVVLSRADDFADGLAGTPLAVAAGGPLLLTGKDALDAATRSELDRVLPAGGTVHLLGGPNALGAPIADELTTAGYDVQRHAGASRVETAIAIARAIGTPREFLITNGFDFPDAVAAGAAAGHVSGAVLLTTPDQPHPAVDAYLAEHPDADVSAIGGAAVRAYPSALEVRGASREDTAVVVARTFFDQPPFAGFARRDAFADALAGGAHAAAFGGPVLLTSTTQLHPAVAQYLCDRGGSLTHGAVYGGPNAIAESVRVEAEDTMFGSGCAAAPAGRGAASSARRGAAGEAAVRSVAVPWRR